MGKEYVDMGLPSGTLWASENEEGYFTFDEAVEKFGDNLPARWQFCELIDNCECVFDSGKKALICKSRLNGNTIEFPALGFRSPDPVTMFNIGDSGYYWSGSPGPSNYSAWSFCFNYYSSADPADYSMRLCGQSVRSCKLEKNGIK